MLRKAAEMLEPAGAKFVVTGEVLGQRPMSQHMKALKLVEEESGLPGLVLRPLSAKLLPPTIPETSGWVDRDRLLAIGGRSRKEQFALAKKYGITDPPTPAGGCLLTDPGYAARLRDLLKHRGEITAHDATLIRFGRYIRLTPGAYAMVGRNEGENNQLESMQGEDENLFKPVVCAGPSAVGTGEMGEPERLAVAAKVARYSDNPGGGAVAVEVRLGKAGPVSVISVAGEAKSSELRVTGFESRNQKTNLISQLDTRNSKLVTGDLRLPEETCTLASPDGRLAVFFGLDGSGAPVFGVRKDGKPVILPSRVGLEFSPAWPASGLHIAGIRQAVVSGACPITVAGAVVESCQEMTVALEERAETHRRLTLVFHAYNAGIALRYVLPEQSGLGGFNITAERTEFRLAEPADGTPGPGRILDLPVVIGSGNCPGRNEALRLAGGASGAVLAGPGLIFSEMEPEGYARTCAEGLGEGVRGLAFRLVPGTVVKGRTPFSSPWRVLVIGESPVD